ncbi:hypothetical protein Tco_1405659 [Tanacetum coccineum]
MEEINNFQQEPDENLYQALERFKELLMKCPQHDLTEIHKVILFYNGLGIPTRQILDSRGAIPSKTDVDANVAIQEMAEYSQKWHNGTSRARSTETSDGLAAIQAQLNNLRREIKKVNEKVYAAQVGYEQCKGPHYTKDCPLKEKGKTLKEAYYTHKENSNLIKEIRASTDAAIRNQGASIKTLEIQIGQMSKVLKERGFGNLPRSTKANPRDKVKSILTTIEADSYRYAVLDLPNMPRLNGYYCEEKKGSYGPQFSKAYSKASHINNFIPKKEKDPRSFTLPCFINNVCFDNALVDLGASISVMPLSTYLNLGLGELAHTKLTVELADRTVKYPKGIAKNVLVGIGKFVFPVDFIILDMPEDIKLRRNQGDDLMPTIEEGELIEEFRTRDDKLDAGIDDYPSYCDYDKKIHIDCARNLKFSCMIGFDVTTQTSVLIYKGHNVIGALMNVPIFVGTFSAMMDFAVLENMDDYCDEEMGDVIFGEPFLREVGIKTRLFKGMIIIYDGDNEVTYQIVRSNLRFKLHTNKQCNKIPPLLKVSKEDKINEISHPYKKLKGFYKGVLNLGPDYIRDARIEEWLTREHISLHEME